MSDPKISVIVPVYNVAPYLARCLDSLVAQTLSDIEIICIDDKSTDNSLEILREYENKYPQIHVIALDKNSGVATARNAGIDAARGEYLGFVDSDDYVDTDFYEKLYAAAKKENADMVRGNVKILHYNGISSRHKEAAEVQKYGKWYFNWQWWCAIYRADTLTQHNIRFPVDVISGQDTVFLVECISYANQVSVVLDTFYHYIRREGSLDEKIMPPHKIASRIKAASMMGNIFNTANISYHDYNVKYNGLISHLYLHFHKNTSAICQHDIANATIEIFKACKQKSEVAKYCSNVWGKHFADCLQSYDTDGIFECWAKPNTDTDNIEEPIQKTVYLFGFLPIVKVKLSRKTSLLKLCGVQLLRTKNEYGVYRLYILYIPIIRVKNK